MNPIEHMSEQAVKSVLKEYGTGVCLLDLMAEALRKEHVKGNVTALHPEVCHTCALLVAYERVVAKR